MNQIQVPTGWELKEFHKLTKSFDGLRIPLNKSQRSQIRGDYPYYGASGQVDSINDYKFDGKFLLVAEDGENLNSRKKPIAFVVNGRFWVNNHAHVVQPNDELDIDFLCHYMNSLNIMNYAKKQSTRPKLNKSTLDTIPICYPDKSTQTKIVQKLDYILGQLEEKRKEIITINAKNKNELNNLKKGLLLSLIKKLIPLSVLPAGWKYETLSDISKIERGQFRHRPRNDPEYYGGKYPFIQTGDITRSGGRVRDYRQTLNEKGFKVSKMFKKGTVMITIAANIGDTAILEFNSCFPDSIIGITPFENKSLPEYIEYVLRMYRSELNITASKGAQKNINYGFLQPLKIPIPPTLIIQKEIVQQIQNSELEMQKTISQLELLINNAENKINYLDILSSSVLNTAFSGKLVN